MDENVFSKLSEIFGSSPDSFNILEETIDVKEQMEYFEFARNLKSKVKDEEVFNMCEQLHQAEVSDDEKKQILVNLASINKVEALRAIEKCLDNKEWNLRNWAMLAYQESKMLVIGSIMDEKQVFISTGLGGKGQKLRYFVVLQANNEEATFNEVQQRIVKSELEFSFQKFDSELEELKFEESFATILAVIPMSTNVRDVFVAALNECNQFGNFISSNFMITNVKAFSIEEIKQFLKEDENSMLQPSEQ